MTTTTARPFVGWTRTRVHAVDPAAYLRRSGGWARAYCGATVHATESPVEVQQAYDLSCIRCQRRYVAEVEGL